MTMMTGHSSDKLVHRNLSPKTLKKKKEKTKDKTKNIIIQLYHRR